MTAPGAAAEHQAELDEGHIRSIFGDDTSAVIELIDLVTSDLPRHQAALSSQLEASRWAEMARTAHTVKGAAGNVGAGEVTRAAKALEDAVRRQDLASVPDGVRVLSAAIDTLLLALAGWKRRLESRAA